LFASKIGEPLDRRYVTTHQFKPLIKEAGLPQIRFHDLKHTCATLLLYKKFNPKVVSEMLGHATIAITLDTYSHVLPDMQDSAVKAMEDALSKATAALLMPKPPACWSWALPNSILSVFAGTY